MASAVSRRASATSPLYARSSASGRSATATATGLSRTAGRSPARRDRLLDRHRAERGGRGAPPEDLELLALVAGAGAVLRRLPPGGAGARVPALRPLDPGAQAPRPAEADVVVEEPQRGVDDLARLREPGARVGEEAHELALDPRADLRARIARALDRLVQHAPGILEPPGIEQRDAERQQQRLVGRGAVPPCARAAPAAPAASPRRSAPRAALASRCAASSASASSTGSPSSRR